MTPRRDAGGAVQSASTAAKAFKVGDHVGWNSEAGHVSGKIIKVHTRNVSRNGYIHHASTRDPRYEIKSDKTDHVALHKGSALELIGRRKRIGPAKAKAL
jgi:hypothetical protein